MKPRCREVESLFTAYVDDEAAATERATVDAHLNACPPCRDRIASERAARDVLRTHRHSLVRPCASNALRARCAAHCVGSAIRGTSGVLTRRRAWVPLSLAAGVLLAVSAALFFAGNSVDVIAAQLAVDHVKCFQFSPDRGAVDPIAEGRKWEVGYGWPLKVPASAESERLVLLGVRRCLSSEGRIAHMMYHWRGQPLSVFVLNSRVGGARPDHDIETTIEKIGEQAVIWSRGDRTYAVVARGPVSGLHQVARYVRRASE